MHSTLAFVLALAASGQEPLPPNLEAIPAPPGYQTQGPAQPHGLHGTHEGGLYGHGPFGPPPPRNFAYATGHPYPDVAPQGIFGPKRCDGWMYPNGICGHRCVEDPHSWQNWWFPPGNMLPHYHYFTAEHGYYYFSPHNVTRVAIQQKFAASIGGDPRHPYDNSVFVKVYEEFGRRHADEVGGGYDDLPTDPLDPDVPDLGPPDDLGPLP